MYYYNSWVICSHHYTLTKYIQFNIITEISLHAQHLQLTAWKLSHPQSFSTNGNNVNLSPIKSYRRFFFLPINHLQIKFIIYSVIQFSIIIL